MKKISIVFIIVYFGLLCLPAIAIPFTKNAKNTENRELAEFPKVKTEDGAFNDSFTDELELWISDHIGFRSYMVSFKSQMMSTLFGQSSVDEVVLGDDGWLYYSDTINDYLNVPTLSNRNYYNIAHTLEMVQDYAKANGSEFVVSLVPNKNSVYGEGMPSNYMPLNGKGNYELLLERMSETGVVHTDLAAVFKEQSDVLYRKEDSHWDYKGALLAYNAMLNATEYEHNSFNEMNFELKPDAAGDLAVMIYLDKAVSENTLQSTYDFKHEIVSHETKPDSILLETYCEAGKGNVVVYRDSFFNTTYIFYAEGFETALFSRAVPYKLDYVKENEADVTVLEIVERNIPNLAAKAPLMEAPLVELSATAMAINSEKVSVYSEERNGYTHIYGVIDEQLLGEQYRVYLMVNENGENKTYEAFPIFETELLGEKQQGDNGYSIYLKEGMLTVGDNYSIIVESDNNYYICQK